MNMQEIKTALNIDVLVLMMQSRIVNKSQNIGTFGLGGCDCAIAEKGDKVYLGHFPPTHKDRLTSELLAFGAEKITIFTLGEWVENNGKWEMQVRSKDFGDNAVYIGYSDHENEGETIESRAVCWINEKITSHFLSYNQA